MMKLSLPTLLIGIAVTTTTACSNAHFTPNSDQEKKDPSVNQAPASDQTQNSTSENPSAKESLPAFHPDEQVLKNDLVDQSLATYLTGPTPADTNVSLSQTVRQELASKGITPIANSDFRTHPAAKVALGKMLFNDRILSGNMTVSCATCHVSWRGMGDGVSLMNDVGVKGLFAHIDQPKLQNILPRNTPALFNHGHKSFTKLFWDGRVEIQAGMPSGIKSPATNDLPNGLDSVLAAQSLFPLTSREEMLGDVKDNGIAARFNAPRDIWNALVARIKKNATYMQMLRAAYPGVSDDQFDIQHIANALAAFEDESFRADASPFDRFLSGDNNAMTATALQGAQIFYGRAQCSTCHAGSLQSDQQFHAISVPQFGLGKGHGVNQREDYGRGGVTGLSADRYKFRTPSLRNVYITGPWGHDGAFANLAEYVRHYTAPAQSLVTWNAGQVILRTKQWPQGFFDPFADPTSKQFITNANEFPGIQLSNQDITWIVEFLGTLTDRSYQSRDINPTTVPSGMTDFLGVFGLKSEWFELLRPISWL